jgi:competence protein ComEC
MFKRPILLPLIALILAIIIVDTCLPTIFLRNHYTKHLEESACFKYLILDNGKQTNKTYAYTAKVIDYYDYDNRLWKKTCGDVKLYVPKTAEDRFVYGDVVVSTDKMEKIKNFSPSFNYEKYMRHQRIYHQVYVNSYRIIEKNRGNFFIRIAQKANHSLEDRLIYSGLSKDESGLAIAMLLGDKNEMNPSIRNAFNVAGIAHILCVSGLHIMIIIMAISWLLQYVLPANLKWYYIKNIIIILATWIIAFIVGLTPSALRVSTMMTILLLSRMTPLSSDSLNTLYVTAFIFLILNPMVLFNLSFQLSFLAVFGIITLQPILVRTFYRKKTIKATIKKKIIQNFSTTTAAQTFCLPVLLINFNRFPIFCLLTNLIVVPMMQVILISLIIFLIFVDVPLLNTALSFIVSIEMDVLMFIAKGADALTTLIF